MRDTVDFKQIKWTFASLLMLVLLFIAHRYIDSLNAESTYKASKPLSVEHDSAIVPMHLASVALPEVPAVKDSQALAKQPLKSASKQQGNAVLARQADARTDTESPREENDQVSNEASQAVLKALSGAQLQIAMPVSAHTREQVLHFLYQCTGIGLAALYENADGNQLMPLTTLPAQASTILRSISGEMSVFERNLQAAYAPHQALLRVYPVAFDSVLSKEIARNLQGQALTQFYAQYHLQQNSLWLKNITLNNHQLQQSWLLFDGENTSCNL